MYELYTIFDRITGSYSEPFCALSRASAVRRFNFMMSKSPMVAGDCELFYVCNFDSNNAKIDYSESSEGISPTFVCRYEVPVE